MARLGHKVESQTDALADDAANPIVFDYHASKWWQPVTVKIELPRIRAVFVRVARRF